MNAKPEIFAVVWVDSFAGPLTLHKPDAASAIASAQSIRAKADGKAFDVQAVHVPAGTDDLVILDA
jgi:hypothetical protein